MRIKVHDDIEGVKSGQTVDVPEERAKWYLANGYASSSTYNDEEHPESGVVAKLDPTLAENREDKPNDTLPEQIDAGVARATKVDPDVVTPHKTPADLFTPVETTNAKGDPDKAEPGKDKAEDKAAAKDPEDATENDPELQEQRAEVADKREAQTEKVEAAKDKVDAPTDSPEVEKAAKTARNRQRS